MTKVHDRNTGFQAAVIEPIGDPIQRFTPAPDPFTRPAIGIAIQSEDAATVMVDNVITQQNRIQILT
jgi:hypothetical protein